MKREDQPFDPVQRPRGYNSHPSGIETVRVTEHLSTMLGSAVKYVWRRGLKDDEVQDLQKAAWCFRREARRLREFEDASMWDGDYWRSLAGEVIVHDDGILGDVLLVLVGVTPGHKDATACERMAVMCEQAAAKLKGNL